MHHIRHWISRKPLEIGANWFQRPPIGDGLWKIQWSRDRWRHVTQKGQTRDPNIGFSAISRKQLEIRGVATGWTGVDMSTLRLPEVIPEIDANPASFFGRRGCGLHCLEHQSPSCIITITWSLGSLQNTENEADFMLPIGHQNLKGFQLQGAGASPGALDPAGGSADSRILAIQCVCPPHIVWPGDAPAGDAIFSNNHCCERVSTIPVTAWLLVLKPFSF